ncbi:MAG TPA: nucleotidyl transferase AbiEii/AbiGii toxin family protein [Puia sp.]|nr:nucleotidyl transferase AbiEii/AbiGii toxin family protein [Puia sp.]
MNLHQNKELFRDAVAAAAQRFRILEIYIEKDYWITAALYQIFHSDMAEDAVFKGGTALSKAYRLVNRFSEDIDIVIVSKESDPGSQLKNKLRAISKEVGKIMPEMEMEGITNKKGMIRKTAHEYPKENFKGTYGQVREHIILESSWLGNFEPFTSKMVSCYITELMEATGQQTLIEQYVLSPFEVKVLRLERTICEKIMSLVRFSQTENPYDDLSNKVRHIYDIYWILRDPVISAFFDDKAFGDMLNGVAQDDVASFKNNNAWLVTHPKDVIVFSTVDQTWERIRQAYHDDFSGLVLEELPDEKEIIAMLKRVGERLGKIEWSIK